MSVIQHILSKNYDQARSEIKTNLSEAVIRKLEERKEAIAKTFFERR